MERRKIVDFFLSKSADEAIDMVDFAARFDLIGLPYLGKESIYYIYIDFPVKVFPASSLTASLPKSATAEEA